MRSTDSPGMRPNKSYASPPTIVFRSFLIDVLARLSHKPSGNPAYARNSSKIGHLHTSRKPHHCWVPATCDAVVVGGPTPSITQSVRCVDLASVVAVVAASAMGFTAPGGSMRRSRLARRVELLRRLNAC